MIEQLMQLHRCSDCPIRCQAMKKPHSVFARMHRWHQTWWPGWKIYQRQLRENDRRQERPTRSPGLVQRPAVA
jgi:hypothetical protein